MPEPARPLRILVAGAGSFGREHLSRLANCTGVVVAGIADTNAATLDLARTRYGIANCRTDALAMISATPADAVVVATPAASHVELAATALARNLCVLLEKPIAPSAAEANRLWDAARASSGFVLPGHVLRFSADHARLVAIVASGEIGEVLYVNSRRYRGDDHAQRYADTDPVLMTLIHDIDLAQWITGSDFRSVLARRSAGVGFRSMTAASVTTANGVICDLRTAWTHPTGDLPPDRLEVVGDRGSVELVEGRSLEAYRKGRRIVDDPTTADDPLGNEHDHFLACAADRSRARRLGLDEALAGLRLADAIFASLRQGREVSVPI